MMFSSAAWGQTSSPLSFKECVEIALEQNEDIQKNRIRRQMAASTVKGAEAAFLPSLSASVGQSLSYSPFLSSSSGTGASTSDKLVQSGSYGVSADWVVWDGGSRSNTLKSSRLAEDIAGLTTTTSENALKESIAKVYIQILYTLDAIKVNEALLADDEMLYKRSVELMNNGQMSRSEVAQLKAQYENGRYDLVNTQTTLRNYLFQLKQLVYLTDLDREIYVAPLSDDGESRLADIPAKLTVYGNALQSRPEIQSADLALQQSELQTKIARAGLMPTVSLTGGIADGHSTAYSRNFFNQMKSNLNTTLGVSVSIPLYDRRTTKTAVEQAKYNELISKLDIQDVRKELFNTIEGYWLDAVNNKQMYEAAKSSAESAQESYDLLEEKFNLGLSNISDIATGRATLLNAKQSMLQSKYTCLLNIALLNFYNGRILDI